MSIDLDKNRNAILEAFNDVLNDKTKTDWALFGYEGQSYVLKLIGTGEDGVEELADDLNSSKIMYAVVRVTDPNTTRPKVVLINWQGEGAPTLLKGTCARHLNDVNKFLRGIHVTVNARTEEEVEPEVIMEAVLKASATTYNFNERSEINDKTTPVRMPTSGPPAVTRGDGSQTYPSKMPKPKSTCDMGTNYKRTNPLAEINTKSRNQFWEEQEAEEKKRKVEEQKKRDEELKLLEKERKQREIDDAKQREALVKERNARILAGRKAEDEAAKRLAAQDEKKWQHDVQSQYEEEQERAKRAELMRLERKKEAESLIGHRTHSTRAIFESGTTTSEQSAELNRPPPRKLKEFKPANNNTDRIENEPTNVIPSKGVTSRWPPANNAAQKEDTSFNQNKGKVSPLPSAGSRFTNQESSVPNSKQHIPDFSSSRNVQPQEIKTQKESFPTTQKESFPTTQKESFPTTQKEAFPSTQKEAFPTIQKEVIPTQQKQPQSIQQQHSPSAPHSNGDMNSYNYNADVVPNKVPVVTSQHEQIADASPHRANEVQDSGLHNSHSSEPAFTSTPSIGMVYEVDGMEYQILPEHGLCARALYDYQAADDTEITFDPEEIITNIDQIDAGWWQGVGPDGNFGLFPANYVELINHSGV